MLVFEWVMSFYTFTFFFFLNNTYIMYIEYTASDPLHSDLEEEAKQSTAQAIAEWSLEDL